MQNQAPFEDLMPDTLSRARELVYHQGWWWAGAALVAYALCFLILPMDQRLDRMTSQVQQDRQQILALVKKSEQLMVTRDLAIDQEPFYMERSIRETFRVKRIPPNEIKHD